MNDQDGDFDPKAFLSSVGTGREMVSFCKNQVIFAQGDASDAVFVIQTGLVRLSVRTTRGKKSTIDILGDGDFVGKESMVGWYCRWESANALTDCQLLRIEQKVMLLALAEESTLANAVCAHVLARNLCYKQALVDQRCNCSEKRLARILLRLAHLEAAESREITIPKISQGTLAEMVGTTRSRVSFFLNRFKDSGFIDYSVKNNGLRVRPSLLDFYAE